MRRAASVSSEHHLPERNLFGLNIRAVSWTDAVGISSRVPTLFRCGVSCTRTLISTTPKQSKAANRGPCLLLNLDGRPREYAENTEDKIKCSDDAIQMIVERIQKRHEMYFTLLVFSELKTVHHKVCRPDETFSSFDTTYPAQVTRFNGLPSMIPIPDRMTASFFITYKG